MYIGTPRLQRPIPPPDFSYLMIHELHQFYYDKYNSFSKCRQACLSVCDVVHLLYDELLLNVYNVYSCIGDLQQIADNNTRIQVKELDHRLRYRIKYAGQDLETIDNIIGLSLQNYVPRIELNRFIDIPSAIQVISRFKC